MQQKKRADREQVTKQASLTIEYHLVGCETSLAYSRLVPTLIADIVNVKV